MKKQIQTHSRRGPKEESLKTLQRFQTITDHTIQNKNSKSQINANSVHQDEEKVKMFKHHSDHSNFINYDISYAWRTFSKNFGEQPRGKKGTKEYTVNDGNPT